MERIGNDWDGLLADEFAKEYFGKLEAFVEGERSRGEVYPPSEDVFNALR